MLLLFRSLFASMPSTRSPICTGPVDCPDGSTRKRLQEGVWKSFAWLLWVCIVALFSLPAILFAIVQSVPAQHNEAISEDLLKLLHKAAPVLTVLIDMALAVRLSMKYSSLTGLHADRLLMTFRLFSAWLLPLLVTVFLDENCLSGWKISWSVCQDAIEQKRFDWSIYGEEILSTRRDICGWNETWWSDGRCSRAIVGNLAPFLLNKLLIRSTLQPVLLLLLWQLSRLEGQEDLQKGQPLRILGFGPRTSGSLQPLQQMSLLTTLMEVLVFWTPFIPLLSIGILSASTANLFIFDLGVWRFGVRLPLNEMNQKAALAKAYLRFALGAGCCFQLWHAFASKMYGRYILLGLSITVMGPWTPRFLPVELARRYFWAKSTRPSEEETKSIEMTQSDRI
ncbi:unnamed protein product [Durusdinium trenchii]|uniref:Uncharacterized protein n=1 Tax=Durusdinium trenchii TaxID=1381693 RepID=A0ABP0J9F5_9DINO